MTWGFPDGTNGKKKKKQTNPPVNAGDKKLQVWSRGQKDSLEKGIATHSNILA